MKPRVTVLMPTYNHEPYIAQAIESYVAQVCTFDTLLLVGDDRSTDRTLAIARQWQERYPNKIRVVENSENLGLLGNYKSLVERCGSEYIAILESDDYWTDPHKLQAQVDFLDTHSDYGMVYTDNVVVDDHGVELPSWCSSYDPVPQGEVYEFLLRRNPICAATVCVRREFLSKFCDFDDFIARGFRTVDYPLWLAVARHSLVGYLDRKTAVYRMLGASLSNSSSWDKVRSFNENMFAIRRYALERYGSARVTPRRLRRWQNKRLGYLAFKYRRPLAMLGYACKYMF